MEKNTNKTGSSKDSFKNTPHVSPDTESTAVNAGSDVTSGFESEAGQNLKSNLDIGSMKSKIVEQARPAMDSLRSSFRGIQDSSRPYVESAGSYIRRYPMSTVLGAVAVGAVIDRRCRTC